MFVWNAGVAANVFHAAIAMEECGLDVTSGLFIFFLPDQGTVGWVV